MESLPLFINKKEMVLSAVLLFFLFTLSLGFEYIKYKSLISKPLHVSQALVLNHYEKHKANGRVYDVFKLKSGEGYTFYTVTWKKKNIQIGSSVLVKFKTKKISFLKYLKNFFAINIFIKQKDSVQKNTFSKVKLYIKTQHKTEDLKEIFSALFFASNIQKSTRDKIQKLGISHLVAISGFHLGIISMILYFLLGIFYRFFQDRYFPYRNSKADLAFVVFAILFYYLYLIDFSASFLRSFVLSLFGFFLFSKNIKIISFATLLLSISFILILFPGLLFSISFWFSVSGVFYIFLFLKHFSKLPRYLIFVILNFWVYVMMMPIVHFVFRVFTPLQLFSPLFSMLFVAFYPLELALHVVGFGGIFDKYLLDLINLQTTVYEIITPFWFLVVYISVSILSIFNKWLALLTFFGATAIFFI
jgi:competence protein ComEC